MVQGVQFRRGTTAEHSVFTGQSGEITVDTDKNVSVIHDGATVGGHPLVGTSTTQRIANKDINATNINVSGVSTLSGGVQGIGIYSGGNLVTTGIITALNFVGSGNTFAVVGNRIDISIAGGGGSSQFVTTSAGIHTLSNVGIGTTNPTSKLTVTGDVLVSGIVTATSFYGDGSGLTGIVGSGSGVIVRDDNTTIGTAGTINFGANLSVSPISSGIVTVTITDNVSVSGILTANQVYTSNNGNSQNVRIGDDAWLGDLNLSNTTRLSGVQDGTRGFIVFGNSDTVALGRTGTGSLYYGGDFTVSGVTTANSFRARGGAPGGLGANNNGYGFFGSGDNDSGIYSSADGQIEFYSNSLEAARINSSSNLGIGSTNPTSKLAVSGDVLVTGIVTASSSNITGNTTAATTRFQSVGEETTRISGNTASLVYNTGGGNIAICTNPSGDITLAVTDIPVNSSFNDTSITFSVFVNQTGTARSCTNVTLNGFNATIRWAGGSLASAISGVTTSNGMDLYSFTGINTVGSASTTANYYLLGVVNGGYR